METLYLIVGLGNPGAEYAQTRHNAGFLLVERLAEEWRTSWMLERKFQSRVAKAERDGRRVLLVQPLTFMNLSGEAIGAVCSFYRVPPPQVLVAVDDADLPLGEIRLRPGGSSGGHHGLESVEQHLATRDYPRLRIGIGRREATVREITGHVLGKFGADERELFAQVLAKAGEQIGCWLGVGIQKAMSQFNGPVNSQPQKKDKP